MILVFIAYLSTFLEVNSKAIFNDHQHKPCFHNYKSKLQKVSNKKNEYAEIINKYEPIFSKDGYYLNIRLNIHLILIILIILLILFLICCTCTCLPNYINSKEKKIRRCNAHNCNCNIYSN
jgi:hypothetical protein